MKANSTISLKLYAFGINKLHDPNWTGLDMFYLVKDLLRDDSNDHEFLYTTMKEGLLFQLGKCFYDMYFNHSRLNEEDFMNTFEIRGEHLLWYLEDFINLLIDLGVSKDNVSINSLQTSLEKVFSVYEDDEEKYYDFLKNRDGELLKAAYVLSKLFKSHIENGRQLYATVFAERVFHDRVLCEFISNLLVTIGYDGTTDNEDAPKAWVERKTLPSWAKKAITARDRGLCAECQTNIVDELSDDGHFDHIVPLYHGGTNDLSNFQLLCAQCNLSKNKKIIEVKSSIPGYLQTKKANKDG